MFRLSLARSFLMQIVYDGITAAAVAEVPNDHKCICGCNLNYITVLNVVLFWIYVSCRRLYFNNKKLNMV